MNKMIKNNINIIISLFLLLQPILDLLTGLCLHILNINLTIGIVIRVIFMLFIIYISVFVYKKNKLIMPYIIIFIYSLLYLIGIIVFKDKVGLFYELQGLVKVFYYPIMLLSIFSIRKDINISKLTLFTILFLYLILIFIPTLLGIGFKTYEITKVGTLGYFNSANEISGIIGILTPFLFTILLTTKKIIPRILITIMYLIVILMMGTKTPFLSLGIVIGMTFIYLWFNWLHKKEYKRVVSSFGIIIIGMLLIILIVPKTNFYKNIETELDFIDADNPIEVLSSYELIDHAIFGQRLKFLKDRSIDYTNSNLYQKLIGIGYLKNGNETKQIEMDFFDIFINHGFIGLLIIVLIMIYVLKDMIINHKIIDYDNYMTITSIILIFILSLITGHIITAPSVSLLSIIIFISIIKKEKESIIIAISNNSYIKEKIKSLNSIDYNNYEVTLLTTNKEIKIRQDIKVIYALPSINKYKNIFKILVFKIINYKSYDHSICNGYDYDSIYVTYMKDASFDSKLYIEKQDLKEDEFILPIVLEYNKIIVDNKDIKNKIVKKYPNLKNKIEIE